MRFRELSEALLDPVSLRTEALLELDAEASSQRWRELLLDAGLLSTISDDQPPGSPLLDIQAARATLIRLQAGTDRRWAAMTTERPLGSDVPLWFWALVALAVALVVLVALFQDDFWSRLRALGLGAGVVSVAAMACAAWVLGLRWEAKRARDRALPALEAELRGLRSALVGRSRRVLARSFVGRSGAVVVESAPHLRWLRSRAFSCRRCALERPADAAPLRALAAELQAEAEGIGGALARLREARREGWTDRGLVCEIAPFALRLRQLQVPAEPLALELERCWADAGVVRRQGGL